MKSVRIIPPGLGLVLGVFTATHAFAWCDERFLFTCPIEPPSAVESVEPLPPPAKPKHKRSRLAVTVAQQTPKVAAASAPAMPATDSVEAPKEGTGTLQADDVAAKPASASEPVLALDLSLQIAPNMVEQVRPATSACLVEQSFNDLVAAVGPPMSQRKAKVAERPYDILLASKRADLQGVGTE